MSRAGSGRGGVRGVYVEGPRNDIYTVLLIVALAAILAALALLVLEWGTYGFQTTPKAAVTPASGYGLLAAGDRPLWEGADWVSGCGLQASGYGLEAPDVRQPLAMADSVAFRG
ncbi:MAG: hypothetical protein HY000_23065 [Planctomycetes bacterium]|nr:hypothetical protein [Planctomycetota bacterium]